MCEERRTRHYVGRGRWKRKYNGGGREEDLRDGGWIARDVLSKIRDCLARTCKTNLHGGVYRQTLTPHESGIG